MFDFFKDKAPETVETKGDTAKIFFEGSPFFLGLKACNSGLDGYKNKIVFAVTNAVVNKLLEVPILVAKDTGSKREKFFRTSKSFTNESLYAAKKLGIQELDDHELLTLLESPNAYQTGIEFRRAFWFNKLLSGAGIIWIERGSGLSRKGGQIKALHVMPTHRVMIDESKDWRNPVAQYRYLTHTGQEIKIKPEDVIYSGNWNPDSTFIGYNPMKTIGGTVDKNNTNELAQIAAFRNGGTGILFSSDTVTDGVGGVSDKMSAENMSALKDTIMREYQGANNNKRMHFTNGFVNVQSFGDTLADLKLIEASQDDVNGICAAYNVSPIIIGSGEANTESNVVQAYKSLVTNNIIPKLREFDQLLNKYFKQTYPGIFLYHDITEYAELMPNMELVLKVYGNNPAITLNELRVLLGMDTLSDPLYDKSYIQSGFVPLEDAGFTNAYSGTGQNG